jgi:uncharacterized damage-inducible protein DinB
MTSPRIDLLVRNLGYAFESKGWHGPTLLESLRGLTEEQARWRPAPDRKCIAELVLHAAYWKHCVRCWITGAPTDAFGREPENWPEPRTLEEDVAFLREEHRLLCEAVRAFDAEKLDEPAIEDGPVWAQMILGVAAHDTHHTGQVQLLKRLQGVS